MPVAAAAAASPPAALLKKGAKRFGDILAAATIMSVLAQPPSLTAPEQHRHKRQQQQQHHHQHQQAQYDELASSSSPMFHYRHAENDGDAAARRGGDSRSGTLSNWADRSLNLRRNLSVRSRSPFHIASSLWPASTVNRTIRSNLTTATGLQFGGASSGKEMLFGSSPVLAALSANRRRVIRLNMLSVDAKTQSQQMALTLAEEKAIEVRFVSRTRLDALSEGRPHNGLVLEVGPLEAYSVSGLSSLVPLSGRSRLSSYSLFGAGKDTIDFEFVPEPKRPHPIWLALDRVVDPQNLGAILRTCRFFGLDGVVVTSRETASFTPAVSKASAGTMEFMDLFQTTNLARFLERSRSHGWTVYGTALGDVGALAAAAAAAAETEAAAAAGSDWENTGRRRGQLRAESLGRRAVRAWSSAVSSSRRSLSSPSSSSAAAVAAAAAAATVPSSQHPSQRRPSTPAPTASAASFHARIRLCTEPRLVVGPTVLVLGSEGAGVDPAVARACDAHLLVPGAAMDAATAAAVAGRDVTDDGDDEEHSHQLGGSSSNSNNSSRGGTGYDGGKGSLDSLNVSVAAGILLHSLVNPR
ncbi:hypothetical protein DFJ73DRAFT_794434 [Zopfochytrium polystomum]|nr:hypothetical protein DFJ73DRAFT_794434 [Zopfochytrium polystomum]